MGKKFFGKGGKLDKITKKIDKKTDEITRSIDSKLELNGSKPSSLWSDDPEKHKKAVNNFGALVGLKDAPEHHEEQKAVEEVNIPQKQDISSIPILIETTIAEAEQPIPQALAPENVNAEHNSLEIVNETPKAEAEQLIPQALAPESVNAEHNSLEIVNEVNDNLCFGSKVGSNIHYEDSTYILLVNDYIQIKNTEGNDNDLKTQQQLLNYLHEEIKNHPGFWKFCADQSPQIFLEMVASYSQELRLTNSELQLALQTLEYLNNSVPKVIGEVNIGSRVAIILDYIENQDDNSVIALGRDEGPYDFYQNFGGCDTNFE